MAVTHEPLGCLVVATSYDTGRTKADVTRRVTVHATFAKILAAWKLSDWERIYGYAPTIDDLIVPTRNMTPIDPKDANEAMWSPGTRGWHVVALCAEVAKLRVSTLDGELLPLATVFATAELKAANRWRNIVTPLGLEP